MKRREFLKYSGAVVTQSLIASSLIESLWISTAKGGAVPIKSLQASLDPKDGLLLLPNNPQFAKYMSSFNKRTMLTPQVRVVCANPNGVASAIKWAQANDVPLAVRSGGHSFEGLSQSTGLVIDTRGMNQLQLSVNKQTFISGSGMTLGAVYGQLAKNQLAMPAGSCPPVGITGHSLGGGYGLLARPLGLACDSLLSIEVVNAEGKVLNCSKNENEDLFWALRGGGAGSFGIVTQLHFKTHQISSVQVYSMLWKVNAEDATHLMQTWQGWAPNSPREITSLMKVSKAPGGLYYIRCIGQSVGSESMLRHELARLSAVVASESLNVKELNLIDAIKHFGGSDTAVDSVFMKGKSDYLTEAMSDEAAAVFLEKIPFGIDIIFDSYGGAISDVEDDATAFAHRSGVISSLQYYTEWSTPAATEGKLSVMRAFHEIMRPHMSGSAYFNYCDLDLKNYATAYWGKNLPRLMEIKALHDPNNFFRHAQSIPVKG